MLRVSDCQLLSVPGGSFLVTWCYQERCQAVSETWLWAVFLHQSTVTVVTNTWWAAKPALQQHAVTFWFLSLKSQLFTDKKL